MVDPRAHANQVAIHRQMTLAARHRETITMPQQFALRQARRKGRRLPERFAEILGERCEHDVEADTDPLFFTGVRVDGMLEPRRRAQVTRS